jgi:hypothetical protein
MFLEDFALFAKVGQLFGGFAAVCAAEAKRTEALTQERTLGLYCQTQATIRAKSCQQDFAGFNILQRRK